MQKITICYKDGQQETFIAQHTYSEQRKLKIRYEFSFVVITDSYQKEISINNDRIDTIEASVI